MKIIKNSTELDSLKLVMFERTLMPESIKSKDEKGKTIFTKTDKEVEYTTYLFRDSFGDVLKFTSKNNDYRSLEGEYVNIVIDIAFNDFQKKNSLKLVSVSKANL